jgi:hypothetical protein
VRLIQEVDEYRSFTPVGDTTLEKNASREIARESFYNILKGQQDFYFTYKIVDVAGQGDSLTFSVEEAFEFDTIRKQIGKQVQLSSHQKEITVKTTQTQKLVLPIKPGDLLWVRMRIEFKGFRDRNGYNEAPYFFVTHSGTIGDRTLGGSESHFSLETIVGFQVFTQPSNAGLSK